MRGAVEIEPDTEVKVIRQGVIRLVTEEDKVCVYHNLDNIRIFEKVDPQFIELDSDMAPAVEMLLHRYPGYVKVDDFPLDNVQDRVELAAALYEKGILVTREPLDHMSESSSEDDDEGTQVWEETSIDGLGQDCSNSIANAVEILLSCSKPWI